MLERSIPLPFQLDLHRTLVGVRRGAHDPTCHFDANTIVRASRFSSGPSTLRLEIRDQQIEATAWGDGAQDCLDAIEDLVGLNDDVSTFQPQHPTIERIWRDHGSVRMPRTRGVYEALIDVVLEQRVTTFEARRAFHQLVSKWGEPAPGPGGLQLPPEPDVLANIAYYDLHIIGVERSRADTLRRIGANARTLDALASAEPADAYRRLTSIPGVGAWSAAEVGLVAFGDSDAVPIGDVHLPSDITYVLTGTAVDDDDAMLEALQQFAGHRGRVIRLIQAAGLHAPRRAPRYAPRDISNQ